MELLYENVNRWKLLTFFAKKLHHRYLIGSSTSLRLYFHSLLILRIVFDLEFQIFWYPERYLRPYQISMMKPFRNLTKFDQISTKILKRFYQIYLRICTLITSKILNTNVLIRVLYDPIVFHNTGSSCFLTHGPV